jgi:hypothetical protein
MHPVTWIKNTQNNDWFDFLRLNLDAPYFLGKRGVYVIWYSSPSIAKVVRLGSGNIAERLKNHRLNSEITKFSSLGQLKVSWIIVNEQSILGVEKYLAREYSPLVGDRSPEAVQEVVVNLIGK